MNKTIVFFKNPCVWYLIIWILYNLQGVLYESGSVVSRGLLLFILVASAFHSWRVVGMHDKPIFFKGLGALVLMIIIYGLVDIITGGRDTTEYLKQHFMALLPIYSFYYYARKGLLSGTILSIFSLIFVAVGVLMYYRVQQVFLEMYSNRTEITNNAGYIMVSILPALLVINKKTLYQYIGIGVCVMFVILSMKRGAILCAALFLITFVLHKMKSAKGGQKVAVVLAIAIGFVLLLQFINDQLATSDYFAFRVEQTLEGDTSGRNDMYGAMWNYYIHDANFLQVLVGHGVNGTLKVFTYYAHNDWFEILINQGFVGIGIFVNFILCFWKTVKQRYLNTESRFALMIILLLFLPQTLFSAAITNTTIFTSSMMGFALMDGFARYNK